MCSDGARELRRSPTRTEASQFDLLAVQSCCDSDCPLENHQTLGQPWPLSDVACCPREESSAVWHKCERGDARGHDVTLTTALNSAALQQPLEAQCCSDRR